MKKLLLALTLLSAAHGARAASIVRGPYSENPRQESVVIRWRVDAATVSWLTYGVAPDCAQFQTIYPSAKDHTAELYGLSPDTQLCYNIYLPAPGGAVLASSGTARTLRPLEQRSFEFLALGDSGSGLGEHYDIGRQLARFNPDFVIHTGDITDFGTDETADKQYFRPFAGIMRKAPFFIALGNHEYAPVKTPPEKTRGFLAANYLPFHQMPPGPGTPHYYSFATANALFICLDTNAADGVKSAPGIEPGSAQRQWLEDTLSRSAATWKFVFLHEPLYSSGAHGSSKLLIKSLAPLFEKYQVDVVFQGHDHGYERTRPLKNGIAAPEDGVIYITLAGGGSPLYIQTTQNDWSEKYLPVYNFAKGAVNGETFTLSVFDRSGKPLDSLSISK
ncbi:MAG: metallophosphoesterase [Candidatus Paceibacterota bacterium]|jgi:predicted phosphodiesterase